MIGSRSLATTPTLHADLRLRAQEWLIGWYIYIYIHIYIYIYIYIGIQIYCLFFFFFNFIYFCPLDCICVVILNSAEFPKPKDLHEGQGGRKYGWAACGANEGRTNLSVAQGTANANGLHSRAKREAKNESLSTQQIFITSGFKNAFGNICVYKYIYIYILSYFVQKVDLVAN